MNIRNVGLLLGLATAIAAMPSQAASMRCGNYLIHDTERNGATKYEILKKCGEPESKMGSTWVYKLHNRYYMLSFNNAGRLLTIREK